MVNWKLKQSWIHAFWQQTKLKYVIPIEVGCHGFLGHSVILFLSKIGITGHSLKVASNRLQATEQYASSWIWSKARKFSAWMKYTRTTNVNTMTSTAKSKHVFKNHKLHTKNEDKRPMYSLLLIDLAYI